MRAPTTEGFQLPEVETLADSKSLGHPHDFVQAGYCCLYPGPLLLLQGLLCGPSPPGGPRRQEGCPRGGASYLFASEITLLVASASCWHLIFSAVAFSKADVRLLRLALSSWANTERPSSGAGPPGLGDRSLRLPGLLALLSDPGQPPLYGAPTRGSGALLRAGGRALTAILFLIRESFSCASASSALASSRACLLGATSQYTS